MMQLWGDDGDDQLYGGDGNDQLTGGAGSDTIDSGAGTDSILADAQDQLLFYLGDGVDIVRYDSDSTLPAFHFAAGIGPAGVQIGTGTVGTDPAQYLVLTYGSDASAPDRVLIQNGGLDLGQTYTFGDTTLTQRQLMQYATVSLSLRGNDAANIIYGGTQGDFLYGYAGADRLYGENGDDWLYGDEGDDTLEGGAGNDWLYGDAGNDTYHFGRGAGADVVLEGDSHTGQYRHHPAGPGCLSQVR